MKNLSISNFLMILLFSILTSGCQENRTDVSPSGPDFRFVFMTDVHLQPELRSAEGFQQAIDSVNRIHPDFVITGGDLIMDALGQTYERSDSLYTMYESMLKRFNMPVYNTIGNHEIFGIYDKSGVPKDHPEYGKKMYENRLGKRYYSFDFKGWHFMVLDGIEDTGESRYIGKIDSVQMEWIQNDLKGIDSDTPIAVSVHIPFITVATQLERGVLEPNGTGTVVNNANEVLTLFDNHNLKLVLQGHLHYLEEIIVDGTHFITGGAVSARWWGGPYRGMEEGFVVVEVTGDDFTWEYVDYGWEAEIVENW
jgi:3',5'-cyclic AMP phosphodiesterase CpdA